MNQAMKNKEFVLEYLNVLSGKVKTAEAIAHYVSDQPLIEHILFFDSVFPKYELIADDLVAEGNKVIVRAQMIGKHEGVFGDIPPTHRRVELPFVVGYTIENNKVVSHWLISDQMLLLEQLGVAPEPAAH